MGHDDRDVVAFLPCSSRCMESRENFRMTKVPDDGLELRHGGVRFIDGINRWLFLSFVYRKRLEHFRNDLGIDNKILFR